MAQRQYLYRCAQCHAEEQVTQDWTAPPLTVCSVCGAPSFRRIPQRPALLVGVAGSRTDYVNGERRFRTEFVGREPDGSETVYGSLRDAYHGELDRAADSVSEPWLQRRLAQKNVQHMRRYQGVLPGTRAAQQAEAIESRVEHER